MIRQIVSAAAALSLAASLAGAQAKPNFAGKWTLIPDSSGTGPVATGRGRGGAMAMFALGGEVTVAQDEKTITITRTSAQTGEIKSVYNLDGTETRNPITLGNFALSPVSAAKWQGSKLVIDTYIEFQGTGVEYSQTFELDATGNLVVVTVPPALGGTTLPPTTTKYKKG